MRAETILIIMNPQGFHLQGNNPISLILRYLFGSTPPPPHHADNQSFTQHKDRHSMSLQTTLPFGKISSGRYRYFLQ
jgi:hypothetical protein